MSELEEGLQLLVKRRQQAHADRQKERYRLAKSIGFPAKECVILQNWKEANILALGEERGYLPALPQEGNSND